MLLAFRAPSPLAGLSELPTRLLIGKWGKNESVNGDFTVNAATVKFLPAMQKLLGFDTVALDFEHNTVPGTKAYEADREPRNVAAHGRPHCVDGEGIYLEDLKWTPHGEKSIKEGLHPDLSPTIKTNDSGEIVFIHSAALCRQGAVTELQVFSAGLTPVQLSSFSAALNSPVKPHSMDHKKLLTILLGLDVNASDADIEAACKKFAEGSAALKAHAADFKALSDRIGTLEKNATKIERDALINQAILAGKLVPNSATLDKITDIDALKGVLEALPAGVVPLNQRTPAGLQAHAASFATSPNGADAAVAAQMGNDAEKLKKYGDKRN